MFNAVWSMKLNQNTHNATQMHSTRLAVSSRMHSFHLQLSIYSCRFKTEPFLSSIGTYRRSFHLSAVFSFHVYIIDIWKKSHKATESRTLENGHGVSSPKPNDSEDSAQRNQFFTSLYAFFMLNNMPSFQNQSQQEEFSTEMLTDSLTRWVI